MRWNTRSLALATFFTFVFADPTRVDDFDPSVVYNGPWTNGWEFPEDPSPDWMRTLHYSSISGTTATLTFTGTSIAVYGSFHPPGTYSMQSTYSIDGGAPFTLIPNQVVTESQHQVRFFSSNPLSSGEHTLVVTNLGEQFFLDFFQVDNQPIPSPQSTTSPPDTPSHDHPSSSSAPDTTTVLATLPPVTVTTSVLPAQSETTLPNAMSSDLRQTNTGPISSSYATETVSGRKSVTPDSPLPPNTPLASSATASSPTTTPFDAAQLPQGRSSRALSKGAIAGIAIGALILLAALAAAAFWWFRRARERTWLATDLYFEPSKMAVPDPSFRGHRPTLAGMEARTYADADGASEHRLRPSTPSSSIHLIGYGHGYEAEAASLGSTPSTSASAYQA